MATQIGSRVLCFSGKTNWSGYVDDVSWPAGEEWRLIGWEVEWGVLVGCITWELLVTIAELGPPPAHQVGGHGRLEAAGGGGALQDLVPRHAPPIHHPPAVAWHSPRPGPGHGRAGGALSLWELSCRGYFFASQGRRGCTGIFCNVSIHHSRVRKTLQRSDTS